MAVSYTGSILRELAGDKNAYYILRSAAHITTRRHNPQDHDRNTVFFFGIHTFIAVVY